MYPAYERCTSGPSAGEVTALLDLSGRGPTWAATVIIPVDGKILGDP